MNEFIIGCLIGGVFYCLYAFIGCILALIYDTLGYFTYFQYFSPINSDRNLYDALFFWPMKLIILLFLLCKYLAYKLLQINMSINCIKLKCKKLIDFLLVKFKSIKLIPKFFIDYYKEIESWN